MLSLMWWKALLPRPECHCMFRLQIFFGSDCVYTDQTRMRRLKASRLQRDTVFKVMCLVLETRSDVVLGEPRKRKRPGRACLD